MLPSEQADEILRHLHSVNASLHNHPQVQYAEKKKIQFIYAELMAITAQMIPLIMSAVTYESEQNIREEVRKQFDGHRDEYHRPEEEPNTGGEGDK